MATLTVYSAPGSVVPTTGFWTRARKAGATFTGLGVLAAVLFGALAKTGKNARFTFTVDITGSHVDIPARAGAIGFGAACAVAGVLLLASARMSRLLVLLTSLALAFLVLSFLCWQASVGRNSNA